MTQRSFQACRLGLAAAVSLVIVAAASSGANSSTETARHSAGLARLLPPPDGKAYFGFTFRLWDTSVSVPKIRFQCKPGLWARVVRLLAVGARTRFRCKSPVAQAECDERELRRCFWPLYIRSERSLVAIVAWARSSARSVQDRAGCVAVRVGRGRAACSDRSSPRRIGFTHPHALMAARRAADR
jgi:hypothetical protein